MAETVFSVYQTGSYMLGSGPRAPTLTYLYSMIAPNALTATRAASAKAARRPMTRTRRAAREAAAASIRNSVPWLIVAVIPS